MSFRINLIPSENTFTAEVHEPLLEAALKAGINLSYQCNSGSCGDCKAKIVSGDTQTIQHADYVLTDAEKLQGYTLLCSVAATSNMIIEASEALGGQDIPKQQITAKIAKLESRGGEHMVLHVRTPRSKSLRFLAGQMVNVSLSNGLTEMLAVASCPCNGMVLQFHLHKNMDSAFYRYVFEQMQASESITIEGPHGVFTLDEHSERSLVMVAQDIGFAPLKSIVEHAIALDRPQSMQLFWLADSVAGHYQENYCRAWEDAFDVFVYTPLLLDSDRGNLSSLVQQIIARSPIESEVDLYLSCESEIRAQVRDSFIARGTPAERIFESTIFS